MKYLLVDVKAAPAPGFSVYTADKEPIMNEAES